MDPRGGVGDSEAGEGEGDYSYLTSICDLDILFMICVDILRSFQPMGVDSWAI